MRFITEFDLKERDILYEGFQKYITERYKSLRQAEMGKKIAESFGWQTPIHGNPLHHRLEIEAFPMDKWIEFKNKLMGYLTSCDEADEIPETLAVLKFIKELESFGKPAGEASKL